MKKIAAISRISCPHHIDHLAPFCDLLSADLITAEEEHLESYRDYPNLTIHLLSFTDLNPTELAKRYDAIIHSFPWPKKMIDSLTLDSEKKLRAIHIPHGHSDKGYYSGTLESYIHQDIVLLYGRRMQKMLEHLNLYTSLPSHLFLGNLRWHYYEKYKNHFDSMVEKRFLTSLDSRKKTILYAPTWYDFEESSTFFETAQLVLDQLSSNYNLIIKVHPLLRENDIAKLEFFLARCGGKKNVVTIENYHHIYSILSISDIYIGDLSSIGYDYLVYNRPMFFFNPGREKTDKSLYLHSCGWTLDPDSSLESQIAMGIKKDNTLKEIRKKLWEETFASITPESLEKNLLELL